MLLTTGVATSTFFYGRAIGGSIGFIKGKSIPSLVAGVSCGALYAFAGSRIAAKATYGPEIAFAVSLLLVVMMVPRALKSKKPVPIFVSSLGSFGVVYFAAALYSAKNAAKLKEKWKE
ncbi:hypothetical protein HK100_000704 [Physocladia obscura]|uniref:Uncharacterized protein n=1 Tax=Physocladia obscura TaxID=109957 RepID=A0AAD5SY96_9FUNG|nr:hypothetical protein HK100_000704 [Physocladia obscura]